MSARAHAHHFVCYMASSGKLTAPGWLLDRFAAYRGIMGSHPAQPIPEKSQHRVTPRIDPASQTHFPAGGTTPASTTQPVAPPRAYKNQDNARRSYERRL